MPAQTNHHNAFARLRQRRLNEATKPFVARGHAVERCESCLLARHNCICPWRVTCRSEIDFVLLMHRNEVFKPTNTGRLVVDTLPENTQVFEWCRTEPEPALLQLLEDPARQVVVLFPAQGADAVVAPEEALQSTGARRLTLVVPDGTWRQASRMVRLSPWLGRYPRLVLQEGRRGEYAVRAALAEHQLSTAEAVAEALAQCGQAEPARWLDHYFSVFNQHYLASRHSRAANCDSPSHQALTARKRSP